MSARIEKVMAETRNAILKMEKSICEKICDDVRDVWISDIKVMSETNCRLHVWERENLIQKLIE